MDRKSVRGAHLLLDSSVFGSQGDSVIYIYARGVCVLLACVLQFVSAWAKMGRILHPHFT